jgi:F-type H+-transporting ATPase subunit gamma
MSDTLEMLQKRKQSAGDLASVVRTMKAMAASNINQYEMAVQSLRDYYRTITLGLNACFIQKSLSILGSRETTKLPIKTVAIVFGSDQGLVGTFNDKLAFFVRESIKKIPGVPETWAVGDRVFTLLEDAGMSPKKLFTVPNSVTAITKLVNTILGFIEEFREKNQAVSLYIFHNHPSPGAGYNQNSQRLLPLDREWIGEIKKIGWPSKKIPQVINGADGIFPDLIREYIFVSIYKACAESLASENASRLAAMERAEKNIDEILEDLKQSYNRLRQSNIDEELFDVVAGFEALKDTPV